MGNPRSYLDQVKGKLGGEIYNCLAGLFKRVETLESASASSTAVTSPLSATLDAGGHTVTGVADPAAATDAVNLQTLQKYVDSALRQKGL